VTDNCEALRAKAKQSIVDCFGVSPLAKPTSTKGAFVLLELARVGNHRNGQYLTKTDLEQAIKNFKDTRPVTIGHIKNGKEPKYGDVKTLSIKGNRLIGDVSLLPEVEPLFKKGLYNKWSSGFKKNNDIGTYLHHLALLGGEPPAIEGLNVVEFVDNAECKMKNAEWLKMQNAELLKRNEKTGDIQFLVFSDQIIKEKNKEGKKMDEDLKKALEGIQKSIDELSKRVETIEKGKDEAKKEDNPTLEKENEELKKQVKEFADSIKKNKSDNLKKMLEGKIPKEKVDALIGKLDKADTSFDFSDGDCHEPKGSRNDGRLDIYDLIVNTFSGIPEAVKEGEINFSDGKNPSISTSEILAKV